MDFFRLYHLIHKDEFPELQDYVAQLTKNPIANTEKGNYELTPLSDEDMARYGAEDVETAFLKQQASNN